MLHGLFRILSTKEVNEFRKHIRETYKPGDEIKGVWHPISQLECVKMNIEDSKYPLEIKITHPF